MRLWRISNYADLSGKGGELAEGRWHSRGSPILYCAESPAGALIEFLVHIPEELWPRDFQLIELSAPEGLSSRSIDPAGLPADWMARPSASRLLGDAWLKQNTDIFLRVPSAIVPSTWNMLINPRHRSAGELRIEKVAGVPLDRRLVRG